MLKTPIVNVETVLLNHLKSSLDGKMRVVLIEEGVVFVPGGNVHAYIDRSVWRYPPPGELPAALPRYGVCDDPWQFMEEYRNVLQAFEGALFVAFDHVAKHPERAWQGGGWRWEKWGPYLGKMKPECDYLDDEPGFSDGVFCFDIYERHSPP